MHILYIETYIIYKLRARGEIDSFQALRPSDAFRCRRSCWTRLVQLVSFAGHVVNDHDFGVTLKRVQNAPQGFWRWYSGVRDRLRKLRISHSHFRAQFARGQVAFKQRLFNNSIHFHVRYFIISFQKKQQQFLKKRLTFSMENAKMYTWKKGNENGRSPSSQDKERPQTTKHGDTAPGVSPL